MDFEQPRRTIRKLLDAAISAVEPERLTREALTGRHAGPFTVVAIGKAAPAMCRGAAQALGPVTGICVSNTRDQVPSGVSLVVGDHPVPRARSYFAGEQVIEVVASSRDPIVALISGGGSALCEHPIDGVSRRFVSDVNRRLLRSGVPITDMNLVRRQLSAIKGGRLLRFAHAPIETLAISDVCGPDPGVIASGPTIPQEHDPETAIEVMLNLGIEVDPQTQTAIREEADVVSRGGPVQVLADGRTAAAAVVAAAAGTGLSATQIDGWISGEVADALKTFIASSQTGITVGAGEPEVAVPGAGLGGRNTHAALLAAIDLAGTQTVFAAFATDGSDGNSGSAGAMVDGETVSRGGDPTIALQRSDSAGYLASTGDLILTGPTGTNVSDLWILWR